MDTLLHGALQKYFSFDSFRPGQEEIIASIVSGHDTLAIMPTGGGKSLCYQLPALLSDKLTIVISPLIALMKDQVDGLLARGIPACFINSSMSSNEIEENIKKIKKGEIKLLYIAPERFSNSSFAKTFIQLPIGCIAIDEAHCISQWGHDFRPEYANIATFIAKLPQRPTITAFTATATPEVKEDIIHRLQLEKPAIFVRGFDRPNLHFFIRADMKLKDRPAEVLRLSKSMSGSGIVYCLTIKETEELASYLSANGISAQAYNAKISPQLKTQIQNEFMENRYKVIVATVAFGMGIDKADIRFVIHAGMPPNLERYYQETGRAGRDGEKAYCILLHNGRDSGKHHFFFQKNKELMIQQGKPKDQINSITNAKYRLLDAMNEFIETTDCRRRFILGYFQDPQIKDLADNCKACDVCVNFQWEKAAKSSTTRKSIVTKEDLSGTVLETVKYFAQGKTPDQTAKIRGLGRTTVMNHLALWYQTGGTFNYDDYVSLNEEVLVLKAIKQVGSTEKLNPIKEILPHNISYDQIKLVIAKTKRPIEDDD